MTCYCHVLMTNIIHGNVSKMRSVTDRKRNNFSAFTLKIQSLWLEFPVSGTYICTFLTGTPLQVPCDLLLFLRVAIWVAFTGSFVGHGDRRQSLKDDSLSELLAATS